MFDKRSCDKLSRTDQAIEFTLLGLNKSLLKIIVSYKRDLSKRVDPGEMLQNASNKSLLCWCFSANFCIMQVFRRKIIKLQIATRTCTDPESFVRGVEL